MRPSLKIKGQESQLFTLYEYNRTQRLDEKRGVCIKSVAQHRNARCKSQINELLQTLATMAVCEWEH